MSRPLKGSAAIMGGYLYQHLIGLEFLCKWLDDPTLYDWVTFEADQDEVPRGLDDIIADAPRWATRTSSGQIHRRSLRPQQPALLGTGSSSAGRGAGPCFRSGQTLQPQSGCLTSTRLPSLRTAFLIVHSMPAWMVPVTWTAPASHRQPTSSWCNNWGQRSVLPGSLRSSISATATKATYPYNARSVTRSYHATPLLMAGMLSTPKQLTGPSERTSPDQMVVFGLAQYGGVLTRVGLSPSFSPFEYPKDTLPPPDEQFSDTFVAGIPGSVHNRARPMGVPRTGKEHIPQLPLQPIRRERRSIHSPPLLPGLTDLI